MDHTTRLISFRKSPSLILATAIVLILGVNLIDRLTGPEISTSIFYLLPVGLVAWFINRRFGMAFAAASAIFWLLTDLTTNPNVSYPLIPYWNALVRLGFFLIVVWSLTSLRTTREKENDLMAFVIHDLRAPLGNTLTALEMLEKESESWPIENSKELIDIALNSSRRMLILVNTILDLARLEGEKMPVNVQKIRMLDLFDKAVEQVHMMAEYKKVTLMTTEAGEKLSVKTDPVLSERVLVNLLSNAIKFTPTGGHICMSAVLQPNGQVLIGIKDDGPGIPKELEKQVFARFGQVGIPRSGMNAGSGLGLAFCKLAIEAQDGRIWIEPIDNKGTLIHFTLPAG